MSPQEYSEAPGASSPLAAAHASEPGGLCGTSGVRQGRAGRVQLPDAPVFVVDWQLERREVPGR